MSQLLVLHMLMKTNSRLSGDGDWLMFDQVAVKKHDGSPTVLLKNAAEQNPMGREINSVCKIKHKWSEEIVCSVNSIYLLTEF